MRVATLFLAATIACVEPPADVDPPARGGVAGAQPAPAMADTPPAPARTDTPPATPPADAPPTPTPAPGQASTLLDRYDLDRPNDRFDLPDRLNEISGLAFSPDGRLFGHDDERGRVHEIDPATGDVGKRWDLGDDMARDDFEGLAIVRERFFLVSSRGLLYEFREGDDGEDVSYRVTDTGLGANCEVEGLEYDVLEDVLLVACKVATPDRGLVVVHRLPLDPAGRRPGPITISEVQIAALGLGDEFDPSAIAVDPSGTLVLVSARHEAIIEIDRSGRLLSGSRLPNDRHPQAEGLAFGPDGTLYLADERNRGDARLTAYARIERSEGARR